MLVHQWAESYRGDPVKYEAAKEALRGCVFLDVGDIEEYPLPKGGVPAAARPPFPKMCVQFSVETKRDGVAHGVFFITEEEGGEIHCFGANKFNGIGWVTAGGCRAAPDAEGYWSVVLGVETAYEKLEDFESRVQLHRADIRRVLEDQLIAVAADVFNIFAVMACSNVRTRDHQPDAALNKKRAKAGKVPLVSYKTLEIVVPNTRYEGGGPGGGTHASPRVHLRRGHIRKIADGKTVWVQACVVGSKHGMVLKDYKLRSAA